MHWFFDPSFNSDASFITKGELDHFKSLRIRVGEEVAITNGIGAVFVCEVADPKSGAVKILRQSVQKPQAPTMHLVQALAKGDRDELAVQACVELGVSSVTPWQAELSIVDWSGKEAKGRARWQEIALSAMKQSQRAFVPEVSNPVKTIELKPRGLGVMLDPRAEKTLLELPESNEFTIVVGPEGGISEKELSQLKTAGFVPFRLGESILRTSSAGPAAVAAILTKLQSW